MMGQSISHYRILEKLGEGGMGVVYRAHDTILDRVIALKFLPQYLSSDANEKERFYHEARAAAALTHPHIAVIHEIGEYDNTIFLAMEYVEGRTLKNVIEHDPSSLSLRKVLEIAIQICEGLDAAHEKGIVHRDIKSDNIMLTPRGQVKIMDFGLAKLKGATRITQAGSTVGTAAYMSPEQAQGEDVDHRSDIFSFGVVLYELLTAQLPFRGEHQAALLYSLVNDTPPPIARFNSDVSRDLEFIVSKALAKDREERYQHVDDMLADLRRERKNLEYARSGYVKASTPVPPRAEEKANKRVLGNPKILKILILSCVVILLALALFVFSPFKTRDIVNPSSSTGGNSLAVMYFEDIPDPEDRGHAAEMLSNLLVTSLSQVKGLEVVSRERLLDIQKELGQPEAKFISASHANQVAKLAGVNTMLIGSILEEKPLLAVTTRLIDVQSGKILSSQQVTNFEAGRIFNLVDTLAALIQNNLQTKVANQNEVKPVAEVITSSPEAYRAYLEGIELSQRIFFGEAAAAFSRAIELDKSFAMAYYNLALVQHNMGNVEASLRTLQQAVDLSGNVTARDRLEILATNYLWHDNLPKAEEAYKQLIEQYPHETRSYVQLAFRIYDYFLLQPEKAAQIFRQGLDVEPTVRTYWNLLAYSLARLDRRKEALESVSKYINLAPAEPNPYDTQGDIYAWFQEYDSCVASYQKADRLRGDFSASKLGFYAALRGKYPEAEKYFQASNFVLPVIDAHRGRLGVALKNIMELPDSMITSRLRIAGAKLGIVTNFAYEKGDYTEMLRFANELSAELKKDPTDRIHGRDYVAWALVKNDRSSEARKILGEMHKEVTGVPVLQVTADFASALVSFEEGNNKVAVEQFRKVMEALPQNHEPNIFYAMALLKDQQYREASKEFQRLTTWPQNSDVAVLPSIPGGSLDWPIPAVRAHYWCGVAYEHQGESKKALQEYRTFLDTWKEADFHSPEVDDAKRKVTALSEATAR